MLNLLASKSAVFDFFKSELGGRIVSEKKGSVFLALSPSDKLVWIYKNVQTGRIYLNYQLGKVISISSLANYKVVPQGKMFFYHGDIVHYKQSRATKDYRITKVVNLFSIVSVKQLFPHTSFDFCLVKDEQGKIVNCAWASFKGDILIKEVTVFRNEAAYNNDEVTFEKVKLGDTFQYLGRKWYTCTEKGEIILAELPMARRY